MITLNLFELQDCAVALSRTADLYKKLSEYPGMEEYYRRRAREHEALGEKIREAADRTIEKQSIRIACKL